MKRKIGLLAAVFVCAAVSAQTPSAQKVLCTTPETTCRRLSSFCMDGDGNFAAADMAQKQIKIIRADDTLKASFDLPFAPQVIGWWAERKVYVVAGGADLAVLTSDGRILKPGDAELGNLKIFAASGTSVQTPITSPSPSAAVKKSASKSERVTVPYASAISASGDHVFVTRRAGSGFSIFRYDAKLENPQEIITGLRGCCGQMDAMAADGVIYVCENTRFRIARYTFEGKPLPALDKPAGVTWWVGCCEPKNVFLSADRKTLYVAESGQCAVNRFSLSGSHLGEVGRISDIGGCVRVTVAASADGKSVYMLDTNKNTIRILTSK